MQRALQVERQITDTTVKSERNEPRGEDFGGLDVLHLHLHGWRNGWLASLLLHSLCEFCGEPVVLTDKDDRGLRSRGGGQFQSYEDVQVG